MKTIILNFANHIGRYQQMQARLKQSLFRTGYKGDMALYNHEAHISVKCPYHKSADPQLHADGRVVPYAFKAYAIKQAIEDGYENIIWMDSAVYASQDIAPFIEHIEKHGYIFFDNIGYSIGDYTSDKCLDRFGMSRDQAFQSPMIMACVMGFNINSPEALAFIESYFTAANDGISYSGSWDNKDGDVSDDMRVKGHRHDQSVASIIIQQMGLTITNAQETYFAYTSHKGVLKVADTVCLWSEGI